MHVAFAVIGGTNLLASEISGGIQALALRPDLDEVLAADGDDGPPGAFELRISAPVVHGDAVWCDVEVPGAEGLRTLLDAARTIAGHLGRPVRVLASTTLPMTGSAVEVDFRAIDVAPDGSSADVALVATPKAGMVEATEAPERLAAMLTILVEGASGGVPATPRSRDLGAARAFRRTPLFESVRLNRLARTILAAKSVVFAPEDNAGNVRVRIDASDGARQISIVTIEEAAALRRATGH